METQRKDLQNPAVQQKITELRRNLGSVKKHVMYDLSMTYEII